VIDANQAGNSTYSAAPQVQRTVQSSHKPRRLSTSRSPLRPSSYSGTSVAVPLSATGGASGNPVVFTIDGSSTATGSASPAARSPSPPAGNLRHRRQPGGQYRLLRGHASAAHCRRQRADCAGHQLHAAHHAGHLFFGTDHSAGRHRRRIGNPVVFTIDGSSTGAGTISGSTLTVTSAGSFVIDANQAGNSNYSAAPQVQETVVVNQAAQTHQLHAAHNTGHLFLGPAPSRWSATGGASGNAVVFTIDASSTGDRNHQRQHAHRHQAPAISSSTPTRPETPTTPPRRRCSNRRSQCARA
jgi:large repetitive protein